MADLTATEPAPTYFTVQVCDFKTDIYAEAISFHGLFTDHDEAWAFARSISDEAYPGFIEALVVPLQVASVASVAQAQKIGWVPQV